MSGAGRRCACTYRIGLTPPEDDRIFKLTVEVRGRRLPNTHRVQHVSDDERSIRMARATLLDPQSADDLPLVAALVPVARREDGWELELQVGVSADALLLLRSEEKRKASWEVGALLSEQGSHRSWEMVGVAELLRETDRPSETTILHTRRMPGLRPGCYQIRAFVHDRITDTYGGAVATIELLEERGSILGPVVQSAGGQFFRTTLPLRSKERNIEPVVVRAIETGSLPIGDRAVRTGEPLEFASWICGSGARDTLLRARRFVTSGAVRCFASMLRRSRSPATAHGFPTVSTRRSSRRDPTPTMCASIAGRMSRRKMSRRGSRSRRARRPSRFRPPPPPSERPRLPNVRRGLSTATGADPRRVGG
jgi:hypothetical protein